MSSSIRVLLAAAICVFTAGMARAEIVVLKSGSTLSVKSHRIDGDRIVLDLRNGGQVTCDSSLIRTIAPDEVPDPEPAPTLTGPPAAEAPAPVSLTPSPYDDIIQTLAQAHGVNPVLVNALIRVESNYQPSARSHKGAMGLMQLMPATARQYRVGNPYDPKANIAAGIKHLKSLLDRWGGEVDLALAAYNAGDGAVKKFNGIPPYSETRTYVSRILSLAGLR